MTEVLMPRYPELIGDSYYLEKYVVDSASGIFPAYSDLPQQFSSTIVEAYANWLSELTQSDPNRLERGSMISVDSNGQLLFPENPEIGDERDECYWAISDEPSSTTSIDVHSHPFDVSFSGPYGDMTTLLSGWTDTNGFLLPTGMLVTTPEHNYLMLKSNETPSEDRHSVYKKAWDAESQAVRRNFIRFGTEIGKSIPREKSGEFRKLYEIAQLEFPDADFEAYYSNFVDSFNLSEIYKLGFYISEKDGNYIRLTREMVMDLLRDRLESALRRASEVITSNIVT